MLVQLVLRDHLVHKARQDYRESRGYKESLVLLVHKDQRVLRVLPEQLVRRVSLAYKAKPV